MTRVGARIAAHACVAVEFRLGMPPSLYGRTGMLGLAHRDVVLAASVDGRAWTEVGRVAGCTGMDGTHRVVLAATPATQVRITLDGSAYADEDPVDVPVLGLAAFAHDG